MESRTDLRLLGCALNGPDLNRIRDICLRLCLIKLQATSQRVTGPCTPRHEAVESYRHAYRTAEAMTDAALCKRDRRTLGRILVHAEKLETYLSAQLA